MSDMCKARYASLMSQDEPQLTQEEIGQGWHFCNEFDGLLVGPGMTELAYCKCFESDHKVYKTHPESIGLEWLKDSYLEKWFPITSKELATLRSQVERLNHDLAMARSEIESRRSLLDSLIEERDQAVASCAVMMEALEKCLRWPQVDKNEHTLGVKAALSTTCGNSLLERIKEARMLLYESVEDANAPRPVTLSWVSRADTWLKGTP